MCGVRMDGACSSRGLATLEVSVGGFWPPKQLASHGQDVTNTAREFCAFVESTVNLWMTNWQSLMDDYI